MTPCPYCGGIKKHRTCCAPECQKQHAKCYSSTAKMVTYRKAYYASDKARALRNTPEQKAYRAAYLARDEVRAMRKAYRITDEAKAKRRARILRLKEAASDAAKLELRECNP